MMGVLFSKLNWMMGKLKPENHGKPDQFDGQKPWFPAFPTV